MRFAASLGGAVGLIGPGGGGNPVAHQKKGSVEALRRSKRGREPR